MRRLTLGLFGSLKYYRRKKKFLANIDACASLNNSRDRKRLLSAEACQRLPVYKLFYEPKLIPGCAPRWPSQVYLGGLGPP